MDKNLEKRTRVSQTFATVHSSNSALLCPVLHSLPLALDDDEDDDLQRKQRKNTSRKSAKDGSASERAYVDCMRGLPTTICSTPFLIEMETERGSVLFERKFVSVQCQFDIMTLL